MSVDLGKVEPSKAHKPITISLIAVGIIALAIVSHVIFASASIEITPKVQESSAETLLTFSASDSNSAFDQNAITGSIIEEKYSGTKTYTGVEKKEIDAKAKGTVTFFNKQDKDQPLLPNTQIQATNGKTFRTDNRINIPANNSIQVGITAEEEGTQGNIEPTKFTVVKLWEGMKDIVYAESSEALTGGRLNDFVITNEELEKAKQDISKQIQQEFADQTISPNLVNVEITSFNPTQKNGDISETIEANITANITILVTNKEAIEAKTKERTEKTIQTAKEILPNSQESISITIQEINNTNQTAKLNATRTVTTKDKIPSKALEKDSIKGRNHSDLIAYYKQFEEIEEVSIKFFPFWITRVPTNEGNIEINIK